MIVINKNRKRFLNDAFFKKKKKLKTLFKNYINKFKSILYRLVMIIGNTDFILNGF